MPGVPNHWHVYFAVDDADATAAKAAAAGGQVIAEPADIPSVGRLEPLTRRYYESFSRCFGCGRIYWPGSHHARLVRLVERLRDQLTTST